MHIVYALVDPRDDSIHYVGTTINPHGRMASHLRCHQGSAEKNAWIKDVMRSNMLPIFWELETVATLKEARKKEAQWIEFCLNGGEPLTNRQAPSVRRTVGRRGTSEKFLAELESYQRTGINPWRSPRQMKHYIKKKYGIVVDGQARQ